MTDSPRLIFAGTPDFAVPALDALAAVGHRPVAVYTQPDRPAGRGRKPRLSPVKVAAQALELPVRQPESLRNAEAVEELEALRPDLMIVIAYGLILPRAVLDVPRLGCVNAHASLLPRWRGAAPIQRAILAGDSDTGVCLMRMEAGLDTGPVLACAETPIHLEDTGGTLHDRLAEIGAGLLVQQLPTILAGELAAVPQDNERATYAAKLDKFEAPLDWRLPATRLRRQVAAFNPWPVAETRWNNKSLRVWQAAIVAGTTNAAPGEVLAVGREGIDVATGDGILRLLALQPPGGRVMSAAAFVSGRSLSAGEILG
ncbi:MAG: methionyl-tRNA formyltransferase [Aquisalimonadaceae bacterium]